LGAGLAAAGLAAAVDRLAAGLPADDLLAAELAREAAGLPAEVLPAAELRGDEAREAAGLLAEDLLAAELAREAAGLPADDLPAAELRGDEAREAAGLLAEDLLAAELPVAVALREVVDRLAAGLLAEELRPAPVDAALRVEAALRAAVARLAVERVPPLARPEERLLVERLVVERLRAGVVRPAARLTGSGAPSREETRPASVCTSLRSESMRSPMSTVSRRRAASVLNSSTSSWARFSILAALPAVAAKVFSTAERTLSAAPFPAFLALFFPLSFLATTTPPRSQGGAIVYPT
jgi:hypothetical protein